MQMELGSEISIEKKGVRLQPSTLALNPDLVFDEGIAVGDVKYKLSGKDWQRADLNQIVTFATGFFSRHAAILGFCSNLSGVPPAVQVGNISVRYIGWRADEDIAPQVAVTQCAEEVRKWPKVLTPDSS